MLYTLCALFRYVSYLNNAHILVAIQRTAHPLVIQYVPFYTVAYLWCVEAKFLRSDMGVVQDPTQSMYSMSKK